MVPRDSFVKGCSNISSFPPLSRFLALFRSTVRALMTLSHSSSSWLISSRELPNPVMINLQAMVVRFWWNIISHFITCLLFFHFQRIYWIVLWTHFQIDKVRQTGHRFDPRFNSLVARTDVFFIYSNQTFFSDCSWVKNQSIVPILFPNCRKTGNSNIFSLLAQP